MGRLYNEYWWRKNNNLLFFINFISIKKGILFSKSCDGESIYEATHLLFKKIGGVTKDLLIDNPKALVDSNKVEYEVNFNTNALRLSHYLGLSLNPCNP